MPMPPRAFALALLLASALPTLAGQAPCPPGWQPGFGGVEANPPRVLFSYDDGTGPVLVAAGTFNTIGTVLVSRLARFKDGAWASFGAGFNGDVNCLIVHDDGTGPALYAAGNFGQSGPTAIKGIARWQGAAWVQVGAGIPPQPFFASPRAMAVYDSGSGPELYIGGSISGLLGGVPAGHVLRWNGTALSSVGGGLSLNFTLTGIVNVLQVHDDGSGPALYAAGAFSHAGGLPATNIARWNGSTWTPVGGGVNGMVTALASFDDGTGPKLIASGEFTMAGGSAIPKLARWDGNAWSAIPGVSFPNQGFTKLEVYDEGSGPRLFGIGFAAAGSSAPDRVLRWDGAAWTALGMPGASVFSMAVHDGGDGPKLHFGTASMVTSGQAIDSDGIARWDGIEWTSFSAGLSAPANAFQLHDDGSGAALYAGGEFCTAGRRRALRVARWSGTEWRPVGGGVGGTTSLAQDSVRALESFGGALVAAGSFATSGGAPAMNVAAFAGGAWSALGGGLGGTVRSLAVFDSGSGPELYAGGSITSAGGAPAAGIARWNGTAWSPCGSGITSTTGTASVNALAVFDGGSGPNLVAGGSFTHAGGAVAPGLARWTGTTWIPLGSGVGGGSVDALEVHDDGTGAALYIGGNFSNHCIRWNGSFFTAVGVPGQPAGTDARVLSFAPVLDGSTTKLAVGGEFLTAGPVAAARIATWSAAGWESLGGGISPQLTSIGSFAAVRALAQPGTTPGQPLFAGGAFSRADAVASQNVALWRAPAAAAVLILGGSGCIYNGAGAPSLTSTLPTLGQLLTLSVLGGGANRFGLLVASAGLPTTMYIGGCPAFVDIAAPILLVPFTTDSQGTFSLSATLPSGCENAGFLATVQAAVDTGTSNAAFTNGVVLRLGL